MAALMVLQKPMLAVYPPATLTAWYYAVGSMLTMILCACFGVKAADFYFTGNWEVKQECPSLGVISGAVCVLCILHFEVRSMICH